MGYLLFPDQDRLLIKIWSRSSGDESVDNLRVQVHSSWDLRSWGVDDRGGTEVITGSTNITWSSLLELHQTKLHNRKENSAVQVYNWTEWKSKLLIVYDKYDHKLRSILQLVFVIFQVYLLLCGNEDKNVEYVL